MQKYDVNVFPNISEYRDWVISTKDEIISVITVGTGIVVTVKKSNKLNEVKE